MRDLEGKTVYTGNTKVSPACVGNVKMCTNKTNLCKIQ